MSSNIFWLLIACHHSSCDLEYNFWFRLLRSREFYSLQYLFPSNSKLSVKEFICMGPVKLSVNNFLFNSILAKSSSFPRVFYLVFTGADWILSIYYIDTFWWYDWIHYSINHLCNIRPALVFAQGNRSDVNLHT